MPLFLILVGVPLIEIALFVQIGGWLGLWPTLGVVVLTAALGTVLMRAQGLEALQRLQTALARGTDPTGPLADGAAVLIAGLLLLTPGFFTDSVGFALLVPGFRRRLVGWIGARVVAGTTGARAPFGPTGGPSDGPIEADYEVLPPDRDARAKDNRDSPWKG
jgi:UPF0716 protein FxsA